MILEVEVLRGDRSIEAIPDLAIRRVDDGRAVRIIFIVGIRQHQVQRTNLQRQATLKISVGIDTRDQAAVGEGEDIRCNICIQAAGYDAAVLDRRPRHAGGFQRLPYANRGIYAVIKFPFDIRGEGARAGERRLDRACIAEKEILPCRSGDDRTNAAGDQIDLIIVDEAGGGDADVAINGAFIGEACQCIAIGRRVKWNSARLHIGALEGREALLIIADRGGDDGHALRVEARRVEQVYRAVVHDIAISHQADRRSLS